MSPHSMMPMCSLAEKKIGEPHNYHKSANEIQWANQTWQIDPIVCHQNKLFDIENFSDMMMKLANIFPITIHTDIGFCLVIGIEMSEIDFHTKYIGVCHV